MIPHNEEFKNHCLFLCPHIFRSAVEFLYCRKNWINFFCVKSMKKIFLGLKLKNVLVLQLR